MQTSYLFNTVPAVEGADAQDREAQVIISKLAEGLVPIGKLCAPGTHSMVGPSTTGTTAQSTTPGQVIALPGGLVADPMADWVWTGIPLYETSRQAYDATLGFASASNLDPISVLIKGVIWVRPEGGVLASESLPVYIRIAAGGGFVRGVFSGAAAANRVLFPRGRWRSAVNASSSLAILEIW